MRKLWLIFAQAATIFLFTAFIVTVLKPHWLPDTCSNVGMQGFPQQINCLEMAPLSYAPATQRAAPAVVSIYASKAPELLNEAKGVLMQPLVDSSDASPSQQGLGSGVIIDRKGYILTSQHVIDGANKILVALPDGRESLAVVVGIDKETDLALLKIELGDLSAIPFGDSDLLQVGDVVLAIGNPFGVGQTVTSGIISALSRTGMGQSPFENFIQTDAAVNPGNSGGALINTRGEIIGINTAIFSHSGGSLGIGFAIPINSARNVAQSLIKDGQVTRGWIGVELRELTPELIHMMSIKAESGVLATGIRSESPAERAGLKPGDVILEIDNMPIVNIPQLLNMVAAFKPGEKKQITIERAGQKQSFDITPQVRPDLMRK